MTARIRAALLAAVTATAVVLTAPIALAQPGDDPVAPTDDAGIVQSPEPGAPPTTGDQPETDGGPDGDDSASGGGGSATGGKDEPEEPAASAEPATPTDTPEPGAREQRSSDDDDDEPADEDGDERAEPGELRIFTGRAAISGGGAAGQTITADLDVRVTDTRPGSTGWTLDVRAGEARSATGYAFTPGSGSYYRASDTVCSRSAGQVVLGTAAVVAAVAPERCTEAAWVSRLGLAVPPGTVPGDYTLTLTHSVY